MLIPRAARAITERDLTVFPVVALLGPLQCGETTLAKAIVQSRGSQAILLDMERPSDRAWGSTKPVSSPR